MVENKVPRLWYLLPAFPTAVTHTHLHRQACSRGQLPAWFTVELVNSRLLFITVACLLPLLPTCLQPASTVSIQQINNRTITALAHSLVLPWACVLKVNSRCLLTKISTVLALWPLPDSINDMRLGTYFPWHYLNVREFPHESLMACSLLAQSQLITSTFFF